MKKVNVDEEGILYAELDLDDITKANRDFDVVGHYARPDIFQRNINGAPQSSVVINFGYKTSE